MIVPQPQLSPLGRSAPRAADDESAKRTATSKPPIRHRARKGLGHSLLALAVTILASGACTGWNGESLRCRKFRTAPLLYSLVLRGDAPVNPPLGARSPKSVATLNLYANGGLVLYGFLPYNRLHPHNRFRPNEVLRCQQLVLEERAAWIGTLDRLTSHLGEERDPHHAMIAVLRMDGSAQRVGVARSLDRDAQAAARDLACLLVETFDETAMRVMLETSPPLAEWLALPKSCAVATSQ